MSDVVPAAHGSLSKMTETLRAEYSHPHHSSRLDQIDAVVRNLHGFLEELAQAETNRVHRAEELLRLHKARQLPAVMPVHDEELLSQELERSA